MSLSVQDGRQSCGLLTAEETEPRPASLTAVTQSGELIWITDLKARHQAGWVELRT